MKLSIRIAVIISILLWIPFYLNTYYLKNISIEDIPESGEWAQLEDGNIFFSWHYPEEPSKDKIVVLVHGFSSPQFVWDGIAELLVDAGYSVLAYDHFGRGYSERPRIKYDHNLYIRALNGLLESQSIDTPVHLVGYSMGGAVIAHFADTHGEKVKSVSLIAPAGTMIEEPDINFWAVQPLIGEWFWHVLGSFYVEEQVYEVNDPRGLLPLEYMELLSEQGKYKGFIESLLSTVRHFDMFNTEDEYRSINSLNVPVLAVWGTNDQVTPFSGSNRLLEVMPSTELKIIEGGTHNITFVQPTKIGKMIVSFLEGK